MLNKNILIMSLSFLILIISGCDFDNNINNESIIDDSNSINTNNSDDSFSFNADECLDVAVDDFNVELDNGVVIPWNLSDENISFLIELTKYNTSKKLLDFINNELSVIKSDNITMIHPLITFNDNEGTKYDLLRLIYVALSTNGYSPVFLVYEYSVEDQIFLDAVIVFSDLDEAKHIYFDDSFKIIHHGWSFNELFKFEEERRNINITRFGFPISTNLILSQKLDVSRVYDWTPREDYK